MRFFNFINKYFFSKNVVRKGFTLAEVLITMTVIGVVAAMTIPTLMMNLQNKSNVSKFKKDMSSLKSAARLATLEDESLGWNCTGDLILSNVATGPCRQVILENSMTGFRVQNYSTADMISYYGSTIKAGGSYGRLINDYTRVYSLADGALLFTNFDKSNFDCTSENFSISKPNDGIRTNFVLYCGAYIDVNGINGPNKLSKCTKGTNNVIQSGVDGDKLRSHDPNLYKFQASTPVNFDVSSDCVVNGNDIGDIFPIVFVDNMVIPFDSATEYVLKTAK